MNVTPFSRHDWLISTGAFALIVASGVCWPDRACAVDEADTIDIGSRRQLFLDDFIVERLDGLKPTMHQPEKRGPVLRPVGATDGIRVQTASAPVWVPDEGVFKLFYMAMPYEKGNWVTDQIGCALAVSKDGLKWDVTGLGQMRPVGREWEDEREPFR